MALQILDVTQTMEEGQTLAVADRILIDPSPGQLMQRTSDLISAILESGGKANAVCQTLLRLGMNFAGRDARIVGYRAEETDAALERVLRALEQLHPSVKQALSGVIADFLADMKSVNRGDSLPGLFAERIELRLDPASPGRSFLILFQQELRNSVYWRMIGEGYAKFGNDYARGLEFLRHMGFCQVSTNPVLAARAFDEDPKLTEALKAEIRQHSQWLENPQAHSDEIAMAATLIALWPNLAVFRPLAIHAGLKDYMVSFQLNPNIADQVEPSVADARHAYQLAADYLKRYDEYLGMGTRAGVVGPNIVFKIAASSEAARHITRRLNSWGIGTNNTVVYTVAQEVQLILDAFQGKAQALRDDRMVTRTYETNIGGRFASHLREVVAEDLFVRAAANKGETQAVSWLEGMAKGLGVDQVTKESVASAPLAEKARVFCAFKFLKALDHSSMLIVAEAAGWGQTETQQMEEAIKRSGTLVARRVYHVFYAQQNRPRWISYLQRTFGLTQEEAREVLESMDVLPASKRVPEDTLEALAQTNMCHTEFPNQARAVELLSERSGFRMEDFRDSAASSFEPGVTEKLRTIADFRRGYDVTPDLQRTLLEAGIEEAGGWTLGGIEPQAWPEFGSVVKTSAEFRGAYEAFASKCVSLTKEVGE